MAKGEKITSVFVIPKPAAPDRSSGGYDWALSLLAGEDRPTINRANLDNALLAIASANNLVPLKQTITVNKDGTWDSVYQQSDAQGNPLVDAKAYTTHHAAKPGVEVKPCTTVVYGHADTDGKYNGKLVLAGETLQTPNGYKGYGKPTEQQRGQCMQCIQDAVKKKDPSKVVASNAATPPAVGIQSVTGDDNGKTDAVDAGTKGGNDATTPPSAPAAPAAKPIAITRPVQFNPTTPGTVHSIETVDLTQFVLGNNKGHAAAEWKGTPDTLNGGLKGVQEGRVVDVTGKSEQRFFGSVPETGKLKLMNTDPGRNPLAFVSTHAAGELEHTPENHLTYDANGKAVGPNPDNNQKVEGRSSLTQNANGELVARLSMAALVPEAIHNDHNATTYIRENPTAGLDLGSSEKMRVQTFLLVTHQVQQDVGAEYVKNATPQNAEKLLQLQLLEAGNILTQSVYPLGVPVRTIEAIKADMDTVIGALPDSPKKTELAAKYIAPYPLEVMKDSDALHAKVKEMGGHKHWINPYTVVANQRAAKLEYIREGYSVKSKAGENAHRLEDNIFSVGNRGAIPLGAMQIEEDRKRELAKNIEIYSNATIKDAFRPGTETEKALGAQMLSGAEISEKELATKRITLLENLNRSPETRRAYLEHAIKVEGGPQLALEAVKDASNKNSANHLLLGLKTPEEGRETAMRIATNLLGKENAHKLLRDDGTLGENGWNAFKRLVTVGLVSDGKNRNQDKALYLENILAERLANQATAGEVDKGIEEVLRLSAAAQKNGIGVNSIAAASLVSVLGEDSAAKSGALATHAEVMKVLSPEDGKTVQAQILANANNGVGHVTAGVQAALQTNVNAGAAVLSVAPDRLNAIDAEQWKNGAATLTAEETAALGDANGKPVMVTAAPVGKVGASPWTSPNPAGQVQMNALYVAELAKRAPADFATIAAIAAAGNNQAVAASLNGHVDGLVTSGFPKAAKDDGALIAGFKNALANGTNSQGSAATALSTLIAVQSKAIADATDQTAAINDAKAAFATFLNSGNVAANTVALNSLATSLAADPLASAKIAAIGTEATLVTGGPPNGTIATVNTGSTLVAIGDPGKFNTAIKDFTTSTTTILDGLNGVPAVSLEAVATLTCIVFCGPKGGKDSPPTGPGPTPGGGGIGDPTSSLIKR